MPDSKFEYGRQKQFAALPYRLTKKGIEVLFVTSRGTHQWIIPKGRPEFSKGKPVPPFKIAALEAREEAGVAGVIGKEPIGGFFYDKYLGPLRAIRTHLQVYLLRVTKPLDDWKEKDQRKIEWIAIPEAIARLSANTNIPQQKRRQKRLKALFAKAEKQILKSDAGRRAREKKKPARGKVLDPA